MNPEHPRSRRHEIRALAAPRCPRVPARHARPARLALAAGLALLACNPTSATDRELGDEEMRELDRTNASLAPPITLSEAVGCDVCPEWCRHVDLHRIPVPELLGDYRHHADAFYGRKEPDLKQKLVSKYELHRIACIVKRSGPDARTAFLRFLADEESIGVQLATADLALVYGFAEERPIAVLNKHIKNPEAGQLGVIAYGLLDKYEWSRRPPVQPQEPPQR